MLNYLVLGGGGKSERYVFAKEATGDAIWSLLDGRDELRMWQGQGRGPRPVRCGVEFAVSKPELKAAVGRGGGGLLLTVTCGH